MNFLKQSICYKQYCGLVDFVFIQKNKYFPNNFSNLLTTFGRYSQKSSFMIWLLQESTPFSYERGSLFFHFGDFLFSTTRKHLLLVSRQSMFVSFLKKLEEIVTTYSSLVVFLLFLMLFLVSIINLISYWIK